MRRTPKAPSLMLERHVVKQVMDGLRADGWLALRNNTGATRVTYKGKRRYVSFGQVGSADILAWRKGYPPLAVECKRSGGKSPTAEQLDWLREFEAHGGITVVAHCYGDVEARILEAVLERKSC